MVIIRAIRVNENLRVVHVAQEDVQRSILMAILPISSAIQTSNNVNFLGRGRKEASGNPVSVDEINYGYKSSKLKAVPLAALMALSPSLLSASVPTNELENYMDISEPRTELFQEAPIAPQDIYDAKIRQKPNIPNTKIIQSIMVQEPKYDSYLVNLISTDGNDGNYEEVEVMTFDKDTGELKHRGIIFGVQMTDDDAYAQLYRDNGINYQSSQMYKPIGLRLSITDLNDYTLPIDNWYNGMIRPTHEFIYKGPMGGNFDKLMRAVLGGKNNNKAIEIVPSGSVSEDTYTFMRTQYKKHHNLQ